MTIHVSYDHECPECGAYYVPYDDDVPCPKCGIIENERFDFISKAVESILYNIEQYHFFVPPCWITYSLCDKILIILFHLFQAFEFSGKEKAFSEFSFDEIKKHVYWKGHDYIVKHIYNIAVRVNESLLSENNLERFRDIGENKMFLE